MRDEQSSLREYLDAARLDALAGRESELFRLRYGLPQGSPYTLEEIGKESGLTRERVRQILLTVHGRIIQRAESEVKAGETERPCARLTLYVRDSIGADSGGAVERLSNFVIAELGYLPASAQVVTFVSRLASAGSGGAKPDSDSAWQLIRERYSGANRYSTVQARFERLLRHVDWPGKARVFTTGEIATTIAAKPPSRHHVGHAYYSAKMGRIVEYSSNLEKDSYRLLELADRVTAYYGHPLEIAYEADGRWLKYYPDLLVLLRDRRAIVVEIMPAFRMPLWRNLMSFEAMRDYCQASGFGFLVTDGYLSLEELRGHKVKQEYANGVLQGLRASGSLDWKAYKLIKDRNEATRNDFLGIVLQKGLVWQLNPFKLSLTQSP